jgi:hypothetical protein
MRTPSPPNSAPDHATAHPGRLASFAKVEAKAREVLKERGFSNELIEAELNRTSRRAPRS